MKLILLYVFCFASLMGDVPKEIQAKLILAQKGDVITLPKGKINFNRILVADGIEDVVIKGSGIDQTILSFENQIQGAEGLKISNSKNITLKDFTIENSKGDLIKVGQVLVIKTKN